MKKIAERPFHSDARNVCSPRALTADAGGRDPLPRTGHGTGMQKPSCSFCPHFVPSGRRDAGGWRRCSATAPARPPASAGHVSPRCHPPRSLEENNYYANLNESRPQPTTGNINIKVRASIEGRGRSVINSITNRCPAPTKSRAETHSGRTGTDVPVPQAGIGEPDPIPFSQCPPGGHSSM